MEKAEFDNRRREDRIIIDNSIYVVINTEPRMMGQIVDISNNGLAFTYVDLEVICRKLEKKKSVKIDLFAGGNGYLLRNLNCKLVSKINKIKPSAFSCLLIQRVGVQFEDLSLPQREQIEMFLKNSQDPNDLTKQCNA
ncbi:MAG: PilZ domain-containing protein [Desulfobacteraceae bacterium]|nr:PilZ domain-containing protein [Desulfobacteraceae bacterium]